MSANTPGVPNIYTPIGMNDPTNVITSTYDLDVHAPHAATNANTIISAPTMYVPPVMPSPLYGLKNNKIHHNNVAVAATDA